MRCLKCGQEVPENSNCCFCGAVLAKQNEYQPQHQGMYQQNGYQPQQQGMYQQNGYQPQQQVI